MTVYLCSVYSLDADKDLMQKRYEYTRKRLYKLLLTGTAFFSPIVHCHEVAKHHDMPKTWEFWEKLDLQYIDSCSSLSVLMMPGWERSVGITAEIKYAVSIGKPISYLNCDDYND